MTTAKDCFEDNISRLDHRADPIQYNLNQGLRLLCEQVENLHRQQSELAAQLQLLLQAGKRP